MIEVDLIRRVAEDKLSDTDMFVVELNVAAGNDIELLIDSDGSVTIDSCAMLSKAIEQALGEDEEFNLTVASAGIGQPLKLLRQYRKLIGRPVEVLLNSGIKIVADLVVVDEKGVKLKYAEKVTVEGKKRKETVDVEREFAFEEIKYTKEFLDFK